MILGDDVGLGKTLESIYAYTYIKAAKPETKVLVLTEKSALQQWVDEFDWLTKGIKVKLVNSETHKDPSARARVFRQHGADVIVTTYSMIYDYAKHIGEGMGSRWVLMADEPNYFKNPTTVLHTTMFEMVNQYRGTCARAYGLTATIIENRLDEAFGIMRIVTPGTFPSRKQFEKNYCIMRKVKRNIRIVKGHKNLGHFRDTIQHVFYGRLQDDSEVEQDLPDLITKDLPITMTKAHSLKVLESMDRLIQMPDGTVRAPDLLPSMILTQQMVNNPRLLGFDIDSMKMLALMEMLENSLAGQRVIVYSKLRGTIDCIEEMLATRRIRNRRITGKESASQRDEARKLFMGDTSNGINVLLGTKALQKALNLQNAAHLFFYDLPWSYGLYRQTCGRIKRTGSIHRTVIAYRMLAKLHPDVAKLAGSTQSIDSYTLGVIMKKQELWAAVTGDVETIEASTNDLVDIWNAMVGGRQVV